MRLTTSAKPILISHGGCAAVHAHPRNKDDETLRKLAARGGYFGVFLMPYLSASPAVPTEDDVLRHIEHALDVCGADHVGIGSDGEIATFSLTEEQRKAFLEDMAHRKQAGIAAPEEDRFPYVPELKHKPAHGKDRRGFAQARAAMDCGGESAGRKLSAHHRRNLGHYVVPALYQK